MKSLTAYINESKHYSEQESDNTVFGLPISIVDDNDNTITVQYNGKEYTIAKKGNFDSSTRYIRLGNKYYDGIGFEVTDGYAVSDGDYSDCKIVDKENTNTNGDNGKNDVIEVYFPKLSEILSNEDLIESCLAYFAEQYDGKEYSNVLETYLNSYWKHNVVHFFEGLFFFGGDTQWKVNGKTV